MAYRPRSGKGAALMAEDATSERSKVSERNKRYYAKLTPEEKERRRMRTRRLYYQQRGYLPRDHTPLAVWCRARGLDVNAVIDGTVPI
jgi:hypothetical protein